MLSIWFHMELTIPFTLDAYKKQGVDMKIYIERKKAHDIFFGYPNCRVVPYDIVLHIHRSGEILGYMYASLICVCVHMIIITRSNQPYR